VVPTGFRLSPANARVARVSAQIKTLIMRGEVHVSYAPIQAHLRAGCASYTGYLLGIRCYRHTYVWILLDCYKHPEPRRLRVELFWVR